MFSGFTVSSITCGRSKNAMTVLPVPVARVNSIRRFTCRIACIVPRATSLRVCVLTAGCQGERLAPLDYAANDAVALKLKYDYTSLRRDHR